MDQALLNSFTSLSETIKWFIQELKEFGVTLVVAGVIIVAIFLYLIFK